MEERRRRNLMVLESASKLLARGASSILDVCDLIVKGTSGWIQPASRQFGRPAIPDSQGACESWSTMTGPDCLLALPNRRPSERRHLFQRIVTAILLVLRGLACQAPHRNHGNERIRQGGLDQKSKRATILTQRYDLFLFSRHRHKYKRKSPISWSDCHSRILYPVSSVPKCQV